MFLVLACQLLESFCRIVRTIATKTRADHLFDSTGIRAAIVARAMIEGWHGDGIAWPMGKPLALGGDGGR